MPVTIFIPGPLRDYASRHDRVIVDTAPTLAGVLAALWKEYPGIRDRLVNEQMQIREHINVFVGNENVRYTGGMQTAVPDGSEITILPAISGGSDKQ